MTDCRVEVKSWGWVRGEGLRQGIWFGLRTEARRHQKVMVSEAVKDSFSFGNNADPTLLPSECS